jgi:hypothetical protein
MKESGHGSADLDCVEIVVFQDGAKNTRPHRRGFESDSR